MGHGTRSHSLSNLINSNLYNNNNFRAQALRLFKFNLLSVKLRYSHQIRVLIKELITTLQQASTVDVFRFETLCEGHSEFCANNPKSPTTLLKVHIQSHFTNAQVEFYMAFNKCSCGYNLTSSNL